jgi:hypothetical protein
MGSAVSIFLKRVGLPGCLILAVGCALSVGCAREQDFSSPQARLDQNYSTIRYFARGLVSPMGAENLAKSLESINGVNRVIVNLSTGEVDVQVRRGFEGLVESQLITATQEAGATFDGIVTDPG